MSGFVAGAAQRDAYVLAPERLGDRLGDRGLADPGRAYEQQDGPAVDLGDLHLALAGPIGLELAHRQVLEDPILDLVEPVVVLFEDVGGLGDFELVVATRVPGEFGKGGEVGPDDRCFRRIRVHPRQPVELPLGLLHDDFGEVELLEALAVGFDLVLFVVRAREFLLQRLDLFAEEVLSLVAIDLVLHLFLEAALGLLQFDLGIDQQQHLAEPVGHRSGLEHPLLILESEVEMVRHVVGELAGILEVENELRNFGLKVAAAGPEHVGETLFELAVGRLGNDGVAVGNLDRGDLGFDEARAPEVAVDAHPGEGPNQHLDAAVRILLHTHNVAGGADLEQVARGGFIDLAVTLADDDDGAVAIQSRVDGLNRDGPPGIDGHDHGGEQDRAAYGADGHGRFKGRVAGLRHARSPDLPVTGARA